MVVSVVICCYTEERYSGILRAVASVEAQVRKADEIIIVVDNSISLYDRLKVDLGHKALILLNQGPRGVPQARNVGVMAASGDVAAFLDDDASAAPDWLEELIRPFADPSILVAGGVELPEWESGEPPAWMSEELYWVVGATYRAFRTAPGEVRNVHGGNMAFRRAVLVEIGGFLQGIGHVRDLAAGDDTEVCIRIRTRYPHAKVWFQPTAVISHYVPLSRATISHLVSRSYGEGIGKARIRRWHGKDTLSDESAYLRHLLRAILARRVGRLTKLVTWQRIGALLVSTICVGFGFLVGYLEPRDKRLRESLVSS